MVSKADDKSKSASSACSPESIMPMTVLTRPIPPGCSSMLGRYSDLAGMSLSDWPCVFNNYRSVTFVGSSLSTI